MFSSCTQVVGFETTFQDRKLDISFHHWVVLKHGGHLVAYHIKTLVDTKLNYSTYDKYFYSLVQDLKEWRHYILGEEMVLHTYYHPLIFNNSQTKM